MYLISQIGTTGIDFVALDIEERPSNKPLIGEDGNQMVDQQGKPVFEPIYVLVAYGFGFNFRVAAYETLQEAQNVFNYIHKELVKGTAFLDIREVEPKVGISRG